MIVECEPRWRAMLETNFPDITVVERRMIDDPELGLSHDYTEIVADHRIGAHVLCGTLPEIFRRDVTLEPPRAGYLLADPKEVEFWRARLSALGPPPYIGVCWRSGLMLTAQRTMYYPDAVELFSQLPRDGQRDD